MSDPRDWNAKTIAEFRANEGRVGGPFEGTSRALRWSWPITAAARAAGGTSPR
jgi:hypothetical protein